jgi:hypothetical protein
VQESDVIIIDEAPELGRPAKRKRFSGLPEAAPADVSQSQQQTQPASPWEPVEQSGKDFNGATVATLVGEVARMASETAPSGVFTG